MIVRLINGGLQGSGFIRDYTHTVVQKFVFFKECSSRMHLFDLKTRRKKKAVILSLLFKITVIYLKCNLFL